MASTPWPDWRFEAAAARSAALHGNRSVLPTAAWILEVGSDVVTAPEVSRGLAGALPPNKALEALFRLEQIGAVAEMPYPGRPHARVFARRPVAYWTLVEDELRALDKGVVRR